MLTLADIDAPALRALLARYAVQLCEVADGEPIPGSFWGDPEAGLIGGCVHARGDTPVQSILHEAAHLIVLPAERRAAVHTDATDSIDEENAVCVLQVLLAGELADVGRARMFVDMDAWGYTFRLGSARAYVDNDADDAWAWLQRAELVGPDRQLIAP